MSRHRGGINAPVQKAKDFKGTFKKLLTYLAPYKFSLLIVLLAAFLSTIFRIVGPKIMGNATTALFEGIMQKMQGIPGAGIDFDYILKIVITLVVIYVISAIFGFIQKFIMAEISQKSVYVMRKQVSEKLSKLPLKYFDSRAHGDILSRVTNDIDTIANTLQQSVTQFITSITTLIGVIVMMLTISPMLTLITILVLPLSVLFVKGITKRSQVYFKKQQKEIGKLNGHVEEMYTGHQVVKAFSHEEDSINQFDSINEDLYEVGWKAQFISGIIMPVMNIINNIGYILVCVAGGYFVTTGSITIGEVQAFIQYSRQFGQPIVQFASIANIIQSTIAAAERVFEILNEEEEVQETENPKVIQFPKGEVSFDHVKFGYDKDVTIIKDMNIDVKKGDVVAIVGPTGAGKTTLVNLLMRFYEVDKGKITVDGVNITDISRKDLRQIFGMVLQDTWLFNGTIKENIAYGRENATEEQIIKAAKAAHADHFIRTLPDGYDTVLNEEASNISQGQKQLLTIARAILADPAILILDEATSSVDTRTEIYIQKAMVELMKGRTNFVIAHRLSTIKDADIILVMKDGDIIEKGNHVELLKQNGFYADLYNSQFTSKAN